MSDKKINDGGPAFPSGLESYDRGWVPTQGLSMRDYFASAALTSMLSTPADITATTFDTAARYAYRFADAMLRARDLSTTSDT